MRPTKGKCMFSTQASHKSFCQRRIAVLNNERLHLLVLRILVLRTQRMFSFCFSRFGFYHSHYSGHYTIFTKALLNSQGAVSCRFFFQKHFHKHISAGVGGRNNFLRRQMTEAD